MSPHEDPSEHIPLIHYVINRMGLAPWEIDEAFSEGLVAITEATQNYDVNRNDSLKNWLALNIRWRVNDWRNKQHETMPLEARIDIPHNPIEGHLIFNETIKRVNEELTPIERQIILAGAWGFKGKELAVALGVTAVEISRARKRAREKLLRILTDGN